MREMFPNYTLYPNGGAFMLCESISDVDENIPTPQPSVDMVTARANTAAENDPVLKVVSKLGEVYRNDILPIMNMSYEYEEVQTGVAALEQVASSASHMVESLQKTISKLTANLMALNMTRYDNPVFNSHLGLFMKKFDVIKRQGFSTYEYEYSVMEEFRNSWSINNIINVLTNRPELMDDIVFITDMKVFMGGDAGEPIMQSFESFPDLIECIYNQPDRMARLEVVEHRSLNIDHLMTINRHSDAEHNECRSEREFAGHMKRYFRILSTTLRSIMVECYSTECDLLDGSTPAINTDYAARFRKILAKCVNLFAIGTMISMYMATESRSAIAERKAIGEYTKLLVHTLESA